MAAPTTAIEAITQNILGPKRVQVANQSVEQQSVDDQIKAATFLATQGLSARDLLGNRTRLIPGPRD